MPPSQRTSHAFPTQQLAIVAICRFSEPIAFNSILAYSYVMVKDLHNGDETNASFYSGLLISAYAVAEAITAMGWGAISDRYGRKPVVLIGLGGVALSSLIFGLAKHYWVALLARFVGGALNGNVAVMQTIVAEMVKHPEHEPRAYAVQPFVWTLGGIIGSAMGGFLAQPAHFYPTVFSPDGLFGKFPYLLPNLVAVIAILLAIIQGAIFLEETNPRHQQDHKVFEDDEIDEQTPLHHQRDRASLVRCSPDTARPHSDVDKTRHIRKRPSFLEESLPLPTEQTFDIRRNSFGTMHSIKLPQDYRNSSGLTRDDDRPRRTFNLAIIMLTLCLAFVAYHQMAFANTFPVYLLDKPDTPPGHLDFHGGLGLTLHDVGTYLAVNGFIALFIQGIVFPFFAEKVGVWKSFIIMVILYPTCYVIMPFISALPNSLIPVAIYVALILQGFYGIIVVPCALILLKNATASPLDLGKVNGLAMSASCLARTVSPPLVGMIYSEGGSGNAWLSCTAVAMLGVIQLFWVPREHIDAVEVESGLKMRTEHENVQGIEEGVVEDEEL
ncbi:MFS general substrate transporter [Lindgomyces ingoldianus]|uniref:MFS general substrate transporter n=1 Tax=Lindgomyces ingoldianus TaxID=673940 RepID=A0ACB6Q8A7_9PLEO|nr:MFS general substrate transporter [Lindgomyces ingoldianus]KAF2463095.1 MFS general substrate transporter [Lindgomyces ingoldianus]